MVAIDEKSVRGSDAVRRRTRPLVNNLYQGMTLDAVTGLYYERNRDYSPSLGRWMEQDPAQFINGANTYQFVDSSPVGNADAEGLDSLLYQFLHPPAYVTQQQLMRVSVETREGGPEPIRVWNDAGAWSMWDQFLTGEGRSIVIVGKTFLRAVEGSWQLKQEESQYRAQLLEKVEAAAKRLKPGQSTTVRLDVKDFTYTMPGNKWNPFGRYLGFGEIHVNIDGSVNVRKDACGHVKYNGVTHFDGFDRYQWGTLTATPWYSPAHWFGTVANQIGTPFNSSWNWTEPFHGELR